MSELTVLLPAYNEAVAIGRVIDEIRTYMPDADIMVGNNGSTDATEAVVMDRGLMPVYVPERGKGNVLRLLLGRATTPYVVMMDSDFSHPASALPYMLGLVRDWGFDAAVVHRRGIDVHRVGNRLLSWLASLLWRYPIADVCCGMWCLRLEDVEWMALTSRGFTIEAELWTNAMRMELKVAQVPVSVRPRLGGQAGRLRMWDGFKFGWSLIKRRFK